MTNQDRLPDAQLRQCLNVVVSHYVEAVGLMRELFSNAIENISEANANPVLACCAITIALAMAISWCERHISNTSDRGRVWTGPPKRVMLYRVRRDGLSPMLRYMHKSPWSYMLRSLILCISVLRAFTMQNWLNLRSPSKNEPPLVY